jgi:hypothetical protein
MEDSKMTTLGHFGGGYIPAVGHFVIVETHNDDIDDDTNEIEDIKASALKYNRLYDPEGDQ